jgi:hypothetical protein
MKVIFLWMLLVPLWSCSVSEHQGVRRPSRSASTTRIVAPPVSDTLRVCVIQDGALRQVSAVVSPQLRDTLVEGQPLDRMFPNTTPPYAAEASWFTARDMIVFEDRGYFWNGSPVVLLPEELRPVGAFKEVPVFSETDTSAGAGIIYVPVRRGCVFQPYYHFNGGPVRGI